MLILIGPSASGKTEVAKILQSKYNMTKIVTYTTRSPRINEVNGVDYNFVSKDEFVDLKGKDFFVETTLYNDNYYGTAKKDIKDDKCVILDPNGLESFNALHDRRIISIYLKTDETTRYNRMLSRKDDVSSALSRINNDRIAFNDEKLLKVSLVMNNENISLEKLADEIHDIYVKTLRSL